MKNISILGGLVRPRALAGLAGAVLALGLGAFCFGTATPAIAESYMNQGLQPPAYKYRSQYARKSGLYLNLGGLAYVRVPTIRLRAGAVKYREVQAASGVGVGHFISGVGHYRPGPSSYGKQQRILVPIRAPYYYKPYGQGGPFYGTPSGFVANYYGQPGFNMPGRLPGTQLGYGTYGFNSAGALQRIPNSGQQPGYVGGFNAPNRIVAVPQKPRVGSEPRYVHFNGATVKSGKLPTVHKPAGKHFIRVE